MLKIVSGRANGFENRESRNLSFLAKPAKELTQRGKGISLCIACILQHELREKYPSDWSSSAIPPILQSYNPTILQSYNPPILQKEKTTLDEKVVFSINQKNHETFTQLKYVVCNTSVTCKPMNEFRKNGPYGQVHVQVLLCRSAQACSTQNNTYHIANRSASYSIVRAAIEKIKSWITLQETHWLSECVAK